MVEALINIYDVTDGGDDMSHDEASFAVFDEETTVTYLLKGR